MKHGGGPASRVPPASAQGFRRAAIVIGRGPVYNATVAKVSFAAPTPARRIADMKKSPTPARESPSRLIDARIESLADWRGEMLRTLRALVKEADPDVVEEWKWRGVPVWSHDGLICTGETYKNVVKMTFAKGAALSDPSGLFNASLDGNVRRAIDVREGDTVDAEALKALVRAAVALNRSKARR